MRAIVNSNGPSNLRDAIYVIKSEDEVKIETPDPDCFIVRPTRDLFTGDMPDNCRISIILEEGNLVRNATGCSSKIDYLMPKSWFTILP